MHSAHWGTGQALAAADGWAGIRGGFLYGLPDSQAGQRPESMIDVSLLHTWLQQTHIDHAW
jgi:hypothetical protein